MTSAVEAVRPGRARRQRTPARRVARSLADLMPKGLYARSLIIIITPVVLLQAIVAFVFMERHCQTVTARLSAAVVADIAAIVEIIETYPQDAKYARHRAHRPRGARPQHRRPAARAAAGAAHEAVLLAPRPDALAARSPSRIGRPFWIDTVGRSEPRRDPHPARQSPPAVFARRSQTYASNSLIFISWMVGTSLVLLAIAILFLRNQIRPILTLAAAVDDFGKGRPVHDFGPRGAREVRQATVAFHDMRRRVERQIEQRTAMLAGVSHDLRTILTRFRLQLALLGDSADIDALKKDVDDMNRMLEGYLAFARGDAGEDTAADRHRHAAPRDRQGDRVAGHEPTRHLLPATRSSRCARRGSSAASSTSSHNACRHGDEVARHRQPRGRPADGHRRRRRAGRAGRRSTRPCSSRSTGSTTARNLDESGTGLGLSIARDIARSHGGDITLAKSPLGGLKATVTVPA